LKDPSFGDRTAFLRRRKVRQYDIVDLFQTVQLLRFFFLSAIPSPRENQ
jgi:hypothetical protein